MIVASTWIASKYIIHTRNDRPNMIEGGDHVPTEWNELNKDPTPNYVGNNVLSVAKTKWIDSTQ